MCSVLTVVLFSFVTSVFLPGLWFANQNDVSHQHALPLIHHAAVAEKAQSGVQLLAKKLAPHTHSPDAYDQQRELGFVVTALR